MKKKILYVIFLFLTYPIFSQEREAKIVFIDSTSIQGYGEIKNEKIYFRVDLKSKKSEWDYDYTKGLIFSGYGFTEKYEYVKPDKYSKPILMEVIEEGNINLYKKSYNNYVNGLGPGQFGSYVFSSAYYVKKNNEENATELTFSFKSRSLRYFSDCEKLIEKIKNREFKVNTIPEIVYYYNDYCGKEDEN
jgi:hypothetical protein